MTPSHIKHNPDKGHVKTIRPDWLGCACCPPNFARTIASFGRYIYLTENNNLYVNFFVDSSVSTDSYSISQKSDFPYTNSSQIHYEGHHKYIYIRIPEWVNNFNISGAKYEEIDGDFVRVTVIDNVKFEITFDQPTLFIQSNPLVSVTINSVAVQRGPFIYCAEEVDNSPLLHLYTLNRDNSSSSIELTDRVIKNTLTLTLPSQKIALWNQSSLYQSNTQYNKIDTQLTLIPYHLWGNRSENEMRIWLNSKL